MRVFVTGATGFVGSAVVKELLGAGHSVVGLARSEMAMAAVRELGASPLRGDIADLDSLARGGAEADGIIHTAFESGENDRRAVAALADAAGADRPVLITSATAAGADRPVLITSATAFVRPGTLALENDALAPTASALSRVASEEAAMAAARGGACVSILRLPPAVHGDGDRGFVAGLVGVAREKRVSAYVGEGANRWPAVHRFDAAHAYRLALEKGARGVAYHLVGEEGVPAREIAAAIGAGLGLPVASISAAEAAGHFGPLGAVFGLDCPCSSDWTRTQLGWAPGEVSLLGDLARGIYFAA